MERLPLVGNDSTVSLSTLRPGDEVSLVGAVQNLRRLSWGGFLLLRTPRNLLQVVLDSGAIGNSVDGLRPEMIVRVHGVAQAATIKDPAVFPRHVEISAQSVDVISAPEVDELPVDVSKKELNAGLHTLFDYRPLTLRHPKQRALFRIQSAVQNAFGEYLSSKGFTRIASPKLVANAAEGGANVFALDYFGRQAYLAQSPQFYKQIMVGVFGRVYEQGPVYRAEKHNTSRHLNEYISLDLEMQLESSFQEIMQVEANTLNAVFAALGESCSHELELLGASLPEPISRLVVVDFQEALEIAHHHIGSHTRPVMDLSPEAEMCVGVHAREQWNSDFVFVVGFPSVKRPFYTMDDPADPQRTLSFDLLFRGIEITTGGQRLHRYRDYTEKLRRLGMDIQPFEPYLQTFKYGMPPHGGLGLGLERLTARICGVDNVKSLSLFPRDMDRLEP